MARITIEIQCDNTIFDELGVEWEVGRILVELGRRLRRDWHTDTTPLYDANGNKVGEYQLHD